MGDEMGRTEKGAMKKAMLMFWCLAVVAGALAAPSPASDRQAVVRRHEVNLNTVVAWDEQTGRYILGPPVMSGAEGGSGFDSWNSTSELNYW